MKIKQITLINYRLYKGSNSISFSTEKEKNVFLISGQNGFGKTTLLHALLWCLYGRLIADIDDSIRRDIANMGGYNTFLQHNLNSELKKHIDGDKKDSLPSIKKKEYLPKDNSTKSLSSYSVSIVFTEIFIPSIPCQSLEVKRSYDVLQEKETLEILIDGKINELSTEIGNDIFINDFILNKDIARFFFFDSERIVTLAESNTMEEKRKLATAYNEVLGVKKYEDLLKNLENLRVRFRKKSNDLDCRNKLNTMLSKQVQLQNTIKQNEALIKEYEQALSLLKSKNESYQVDLLREGNGMTMEEFSRLEGVVEASKKKDSEYRQQLKTFLEYAPFVIAGKVLLNTMRQFERDYKIKTLAQNVNNQNDLLTKIESDLLFSLQCLPIAQKHSQKMQNAIQKTLSKYKGIQNSDAPLLNITKEDYQELVSIFNHIKQTYKIEFEHLADDYRKNKQILDRTSRRISILRNNENDLLIKKIREEKNVVEKQIQETESNIRSLFEAKGTIIKDLSTISKQVSELQKKVRLDDNDVKKDVLAEQLIKELNAFLLLLKQEKKYSLEHRIRNTMNALMHKEEFIGRVKVQIIDDGLDIDLYSPDGSIIRKDSLSKGEQQLYATSILKALVDESGIEFPVFIDSPLQKFDKSHANKIISEFYPTISKQVVLFPLLHKELTKQELDLMKPLVNAAYLIINENSRSFFKHVSITTLMND